MKGGGGVDFVVIVEKKKIVFYLFNLNFDFQLLGYIVYFIEVLEVCLGVEGDIVFKGLRY